MNTKSENGIGQTVVSVPLAAFTKAGVEPDGRIARLSGTRSVDVRLSAGAAKAIATHPSKERDLLVARAAGNAQNGGRGSTVGRVYDHDLAAVLSLAPAEYRKQQELRRPAIV